MANEQSIWSKAVAGFMSEVMDKSVLFIPSQIVLTAGAASAIEMGCSLRNTEYIVRAVIFTGQETKVMMNSMNVPSKRSTLEKKLDKVILALFCLLFCMCLIGAICRIKTRVNWISSTLIRGLRIKTREDCISPVKKCFEGKDGLSYANILRSRNKFVDALAIYESVVEKDSKNVEAHIGKGICLHMQNMGRPAFESFAEAIRLDPQNACALTHCGIFYKDEGRLVEAAESYEKALRANSSYKPAAECLSIVLTDLGTSLKLAGNTQEGIQKYYEAIKIDQHYAPAYYNLGVVYSEMMQYDMALNCYEKAALERPMYAEAYCNMGVIYKNRGDLESVIAYYERCLAISPNFEIAKNNMAIALTDLGTKVVSSFTQILKWDYVVSSYDLPNLVLSRE